MAKKVQDQTVETVVKSDEVIETVKPVVTELNVSKIVKALGVPTISGIEVSIEDATNQTRKVNLSGIIDKFNESPDGMNKLGYTNRETLSKAIADLISFSTPQRTGYVLASLLGIDVKTEMKLAGYTDVNVTNQANICLIVNDMTVGARGRKSSGTEVFEL